MSQVFRQATTVSKHVNLPYSAWAGIATKPNVYLKKIILFYNQNFHLK